MKGKLIVIAGTDGSGKRTQTKLIVERLRKEGVPVETIDFPQYGTPGAAMVEEHLNGKLGSAREVGPYRASILFAVDRYAASFKLREWLEQGKVIVCDRYVSANQGHQTGKIKDPAERDKFLEWLEELEFGIFGIPRPDANILLYMPSQIGQQLVDKKGHRDYVGGKKRDVHEADLQHLKDAEEAYLYVAKKFDWLKVDCYEDANALPVQLIHEKVWAEVQSLLKN